MGGYRDYRAGFRREKGGYGPLRAPAHIRASARFDYQPDVCKDYKETGFCGYGDACKFLHDRGDYKSGWQLDKEWDDAKKATTMPGRRQDDDDADADANGGELPFACSICRLPFRDPVVTKCKHYFCGNCALKLYSKNKKCFVCNKATLASSTQLMRSGRRWRRLIGAPKLLAFLGYVVASISILLLISAIMMLRGSGHHQVQALFLRKLYAEEL